MRQLATLIRVLAEVNEIVCEHSIESDQTKQMALVSSHLQKVKPVTKLDHFVRATVEGLFELSGSPDSPMELSLEREYLIYLNRVKDSEKSEKELREWLTRVKPESFDIFIKEGDPEIRIDNTIVAMRQTDSIKYKTLVCLIRENQPSISFMTLHDLIGRPFEYAVADVEIRGKMGDNLSKILDQLPVRKKTGKRDWWTVEKRRIFLNPALKTCLITGTTSSSRDSMLHNILR